MDFHDILVIILMFAVPVVSAVIDSRNKAKKKAARGQAQRPGTFRPFTSVDPEMPEEEDEEDDGFCYEPEEPRESPEAIPFKDFVEGQSSVQRPAEAPAAKAVEEPEEKEKIDVKKLIVYDAIMNPKFKEHDGLI